MLSNLQHPMSKWHAPGSARNFQPSKRHEEDISHPVRSVEKSPIFGIFIHVFNTFRKTPQRLHVGIF
jgi:hypothetical protein